jgi:hypothetical protein
VGIGLGEDAGEGDREVGGAVVGGEDEGDEGRHKRLRGNSILFLDSSQVDRFCDSF